MDFLLNNPQALGLIVGVLLPLVTSVIQQPKLPRWARVAVAVAAAIIAGTGTVLAAGEFDPGNWLSTVAAVLIAAQTSYESIWQPSGVTGYIETATSPARYLEDAEDYDYEDDYADEYDDLAEDLGEEDPAA